MSTAVDNSEPPAVWLQWHGDGDPADPGLVEESAVTWSREKVFPGDVEYVQAAKLRELVTT